MNKNYLIYVSGFFLGLWILVVYPIFLLFKPVPSMESLSKLGDFTGGVVGTIISFISLGFSIFATIYVYRAYINQKNQSYVEMVLSTILTVIEKIDDLISELSIKKEEHGITALDDEWRGKKALQLFTTILVITRASCNQDVSKVMNHPEFKKVDPFYQRTSELRNELTNTFTTFDTIINDPERGLEYKDIKFLYVIIKSKLPFKELQYLMNLAEYFEEHKVDSLKKNTADIIGEDKDKINAVISGYQSGVDAIKKTNDVMNYISDFS